MGGLRSLLILALSGASLVLSTPPQNLAAEIAGLLAAGAIPGAPTAGERELLGRLYPPGASEPLWLAEAGGLTPEGRQALDLLAGADSHGLNPAHYRVRSDPRSLVPFEVELSLAMLRYLGDITFGRVDPAGVGHHLPARGDRSALPASLRQAASAGHTRDAVSAAMPLLGGYQGLRDGLVKYRALAARPALPALPATSPSIHVGEPLPWAAALRAHLVAFGDLLPSTGDGVAGVYDPALEGAVRQFQRRHGLTDDGVIGKSTLAALRVPITTRVEQIEMALERLRWLPRDLSGSIILVNIPMYRLSAFDDIRSAAPAITMKVVVGMRGRYQTPVFMSQVEHVVFRPYWNVPPSIVHGELLPKARANPGYLAAHRYELVRGDTDRGEVVPFSPEALRALANGALRLRQRPGPGNALGLVKFVLPNDYDVFLHDTPSVSAFQRDQRALSHGCVRVENPIDLAAWVLGAPLWPSERVTEATAGRDAQLVPVERPVHVVVMYTTAAADAGGTVHFAADIYGHDARLARVLRERGGAADWTSDGQRP